MTSYTPNKSDVQPATNTTTEHAKTKETERLHDGPVSVLGEEKHQEGVQDIKKKAKPVDCADCE